MSRRRRAVTTALLLVLMAGFGVGVNRYLASRTRLTDAPAQSPTQVHVAPQLVLPGTVYFADNGGLFALHGTRVTQLRAQGGGWTQPVLLPNGGGLLAVRVTTNYYSDLYELSLNGTVEKQLSHDSSTRVTATDHGQDDWIYYPAVGPGNTLYFSYDYPKGDKRDLPQCCYQVDLSIWKTVLGSTEIDRAAVKAAFNGAQNGISQVSWANYYTGGDVSPVPLLDGGLLYVDYETSSYLSTPIPGMGAGDEVSQIRMDPKPLYNVAGSSGTPLTQPADDCAQPALNPAQTEIAMICTPTVNGAASPIESDLVVASFDEQTGTIGPLHRLVTGTMAASPAWSGDGRDLVYEAPASGNGYFQLWYVRGAASATPAQPKQVTTNLNLDGSTPAWSPG